MIKWDLDFPLDPNKSQQGHTRKFALSFSFLYNLQLEIHLHLFMPYSYASFIYANTC